MSGVPSNPMLSQGTKPLAKVESFCKWLDLFSPKPVIGLWKAQPKAKGI